MSFSRDCFIGIDTSNYTTSAAVCDADGNIIANIKRLLPVKDGERGLRQSDAVFAHIKNLPEVLSELGDVLKDRSPVAIGCSVKPRDAEGSYMPCFLCGKASALSMSSVSGAPIFEFSHQNGHIMAALYSSGAMHLLNEPMFAAFHVSGGTTELLLVRNSKDTFKVELIGGTSDLNGGQAIDRIGVAMGLGFPCGRVMEKMALEGNPIFEKTKISVKGLNCNISGIENKALEFFRNGGDVSSVSAMVFDFIGRTLSALTDNLISEYGDIPVVYSGGVMSNSIIKNMLSKRKNTFFAEPAFSSDNASGTALLCRRKYLYERSERSGDVSENE